MSRVEGKAEGKRKNWNLAMFNFILQVKICKANQDPAIL